jgi:protein-tyrosine phosphatase
MLKYPKLLWELIVILVRRIRTQGLKRTLVWLWAVGFPYVTGRVPLRWSKVTPQLYLGPQYGSAGLAGLRRAGINASVSLRDEYDDAQFGLALADYSYLPTVDNTAPSMQHLDEGVAFIKRMVDDGKIVYVHCGSGVGRSPTVVAAYLIEQGKSMEEAIEQIHHVRPFIRILPEQIERLKEYETHVRALEAERKAAEEAEKAAEKAAKEAERTVKNAHREAEHADDALPQKAVHQVEEVARDVAAKSGDIVNEAVETAKKTVENPTNESKEQ